MLRHFISRLTICAFVAPSGTGTVTGTGTDYLWRKYAKPSLTKRVAFRDRELHATVRAIRSIGCTC